MRAFANGYYKSLKRMYDYFGVYYDSSRFIYTLSSTPRTMGDKIRPYFIHSSNNHQVPPLKPEGSSWGSWLLELCYLFVCYYWFTVCCFLVKPKAAEGSDADETFSQYLERIGLPRYYIKYYLLPLMSSVTTCPHDALLKFPAIDVVTYEKGTFRQPHYTIEGGVRKIQAKLSGHQNVRFLSTVTEVRNIGAKVKVVWKDEDTGHLHSTFFDHVIMAVTPDVIGSIFLPLRKEMATIPTVQVPSVVHFDSARLPDSSQSARKSLSRDRLGKISQPIHMCSNTNTTESTHEHPSSVFISTSPILPIHPAKILHSVTFTRVLRTTESRQSLRRIFDARKLGYDSEKAEHCWQNGNGNVWLVGGWCWDGMVMLEGCVISAMRVADSLGVKIPW